MRNLSVLRDSVQTLPSIGASSGDITCVAYDSGLSTLLVLTSQGYVHAFELCDESNSSYSDDMPMLPGLLTSACNAVWNLNIEKEDDNGWFYVSILAETGDIACISRSGSIASIKAEIGGGGCGWSSEIGIEGDVDNGIAHAQWSPDQTVLIVITNNNSLLSITSSWDVLSEIPLEPRLIPSPASLSWRADGEYFSVVSTDREDGYARMRVFNKDLELTAIGRNVAEGAWKLVRGLGGVTAFGSNGSLIAVPQQRVAGHLLIAFLERNGLRHSDLEVRCPAIPDGCDCWTVAQLFWDLPSQLLAVALRAENRDDGSAAAAGVVQLYYRNNYHWYLKKQWSARGLTCLGFDSEVVDRLYLAQSNVITSADSSSSSAAAVRIVDVHWETQSCITADCTAAVVDGSSLLLTPLGIAITPPPLSRHKITLKSPCNHLSFWSRNNEWGIAVLSDGFNITLLLSDSEGKGSVESQIEFNLQQEVAELLAVSSAAAASTIAALYPRAICASQIGAQQVALSVLCCSAQPICARGSNCNASRGISSDVIIIAHFNTDSRQLTRACLRVGVQGVATRLSPWPRHNGSARIAVGVSGGSAFEVLCMSLDINDTSLDSGSTSALQSCSFADSLLPLASPLVLPETCPQLTVLSSSDGSSSVVGLSSRNRLYFGEYPLAFGVSSYALNAPLGVLMYTSIGTRPHLHFVSTKQLLSVSSAAADVQVGDCAAPRPIERGGRIVACVPGDTRVVIQLPRGNLESFEPRPLTLKHVRALIEDRKLVECLLLMRRQRVDMNYLVDFDQALFFTEVQRLCREALRVNPELLSLLISSLDTSDAAVKKYSDPLGEGVAGSAPIAVAATVALIGEAKINGVCGALREALLPLLLEGQTGALNPLMCAYAKQRPPLLGDALRLLRDLCSTRSQQPAAMSQQQMLAAMKYLAFLQDGALLFNAALGNCDFELSRAVARQCQMDPKVFMPLIASFETVGLGQEQGSPRYCLMRHRVSIHLKRYDTAIDCALQCLQAIGLEPEQGRKGDDAIDLAALITEVLTLVSANDLFEYAMPKLSQILHNASIAPVVYASLDTLSTRMRHAFGLQCICKSRYRDAAAAFLSERPPCYEDAARACRLEGNWREALLIASRHGSHAAAQAMAMEIVAAYREGLELGESELLFSADSAGLKEETGFYSPYNDRSVEAASICLDYCNDVEGCVAILLLSQKWTCALQAALRRGRLDLLHDEIAPAARAGARDLQSLLAGRNKKIVEYAAELSKLWADPADRLQKVASTEPALLAELKGGATDAEYDETKSDFSALTMQSGASYASNISSASKRSTSSSVSVLSTLSLSSQHSTSSAASTGTFGIEGLAHSLLSRGGGKKDQQYAEPKELHGKRLKREHKNRVRGQGRDVWGLRREAALIEEMWDFACIDALAHAARDLLDVFLLLGGEAELAAASQLQRAMDAHVAMLKANPAPVAPAYPPEWLAKRFMNKIRHFQEGGIAATALGSSGEVTGEAGAEGAAVWNSKEEPHVEVDKGSVVTWWAAAASGIKMWLKFKRAVLC